MTSKRIIPLLIVFLLIIGISACRSDGPEEAVILPAEAGEAIAHEGAGDLDAGDQDAEDLDAGDHDGEELDADDHDAEDLDSSEHDGDDLDAEMPEEWLPKPVALNTATEAVAFSMGDADAPVEIVEFTDYQCPFCQRHGLQTMPELMEKLVESGQVFYAIKDLPLDRIHPEARSASVAARCAGEQDAYLPMHDAIFAAQAEWSGAGDETAVIFSDLAAELQLDVTAFDACVAGGRQADKVQANVNEALALGLEGTPFFFIDGYALSGAQPYAVFEGVVELAEKGELGEVIAAQARQAYEAMVAQQAAAAQAAAQPAAPVDVSLDDAFAVGDPDAPVTIVEYSDYQCPFCARHGLQTFSKIASELVETGQVRYVFKDMPSTSIHPQATLAAEAARCAGDQGSEAYMTMHDKLFEEQGAWSGRGNAADLFVEYAGQIGLDGEVFATCLENHEFAAAVQADALEARDLGFSGTPSFLINGQPLVGAHPYEVFERVVESLIVAEAPAQTASN
jgi:protein-disulfide isomerase